MAGTMKCEMKNRHLGGIDLHDEESKESKKKRTKRTPRHDYKGTDFLGQEALMR